MAESPGNRQDAQRLADRLRIFRSELSRLEADGILTLSPEQKSGVDAYLQSTLSELAVVHDIDTSDSERRLSLGLRLASTLGGLAICAAVVLFFLQFWGYFHTWVQLTLVATAPLVTLPVLEFAARKERSLYFAGLISIVAVACFIQNLVTVGEVFNLRDSPEVLLAWGLFALALAYACGLRLMLAAGLIGVALWVPGAIHAWRGFSASELMFLSRPEPLAAAALLILAVPLRLRHPRLPEFPGVYRLVGMILFFVPVLVLAGGEVSSYLPLGQVAIERIYEVLALAGSAAAIWMGVRRDRDGMVNLATVFFCIALYMRLHRTFWDLLPRYLFFAVIGAVAVVLVVVFRRVRSRMKEGRRP